MKATIPGASSESIKTSLFAVSAALFVLPFCSTARVTPNPAFWGEWIAVLVFALLWLLVGLRGTGSPAPPRKLSIVTLMFLGLAVLTLAQTGMGRVRFVSEGLLAGVVLLITAQASHMARRLADVCGEAWLARAAATGFVLALWLNAVSVVLGFAGYSVIFWEVVPAPPQWRGVGLIGQANQLGVLAVIAMTAVVYLRFKELVPRWFCAMTIGLAALVSATTGSRTAIVVYMVLAALYAWHATVAPAPGRLPRRGLMLATATLFFAAVHLSWAALVPQLGSETGAGVSALRSGDAGRTALLADAWQLWLAHPWLGVGYGNYGAARLFELGGPMPAAHADHAHNFIAQVAAEWGLLGLVLVLPPLAVLVRSVLARRRPGDVSLEQIFFGMGVTAVLLHSLVEHPLWFSHYLLPFSVLSAVLAQPAWRLPGRTLPALRWAPVIGASLVVAGCAYAAWDYERSQNMALRMKSQIGAGQYVVANVSFKEATRVAISTFFPVYAEIMQARTLPLDSDFAEYRLKLSRQALVAVTSGETVARYVIHLTLAGHPDDSLAFLTTMARRNRRVHDEAMRFLDVLSGADPRIAEVYERAKANAAG